MPPPDSFTDIVRQAEAAGLNLADPLSNASHGEAATRRIAFLADIGAALAASLDYEQTLQRVADLSIPVLGDLCIVDVVEDGQLRRVAHAHVVPAKGDLLEELRRRYPPDRQSPQPAGRVIRSGQPELIPRLTPDLLASHARNADHVELIKAIGIRSHLAVPLVSRGVIVGVISLGITESDRQFGEEDIPFALDVARRAAAAVDNARLYHQAQLELHERRRADAARKLSEDRFRAVMEQSPLSVQIFDPTGRTVQVNRAWEQLWGVTLDQIPEYNVLQDPQLETRGIAGLIRQAFDGETVQIPAIRYDPETTLPARTSHGDAARWVSALAYPIKDDDGHVREVVLVHVDVTQSRVAEERLRISDERLRLTLAAARLNIWDWDLATDRVECSENARDFWGIDVGKAGDFVAVVHPDDQPALAAAAADAIATGESYHSEYRLRGPDGRVRWVQSRGRVDRGADGRAQRIIGVTVDLSDVKMAEEATRLLADAGETLGASLDYQATLQNLARVLVPRLADWYAVDLLSETGTLERVSVHHPDPRRVAVANDLFTRFPPRRTDPYGAWHVIATQEPEWTAEIGDHVLEALAQSPEHLRLLRELAVSSYVCVPLVAAGAPIGVLSLAFAESGRRYRPADVALARDLARRAAAAVENARLYHRLRAEDRRKDEFLATLAHELRNPLAPLRTGIELLRIADSDEAVEKTRRIMERQLEHMVRLIDDLLDLSRVTRGKVRIRRERVDLWTIVGTALEASRPLIDAANLTLVVHLPAEPVVLDGDRTRLAQVLSNILNNAAKYTESGGRVSLDAVRDGGDIEIRIADSGVGIPADMLTQVFEMFAQVGRSLARSQGGLGIGLTLVRGLVELHGGRVWAESAGLGHGSTFVVRLPVAEAAAPAAGLLPPMLTPSAAAPAAARRVLVVDDNADAAETLAALLTLDGHDVRTAGSGPAALDMLRDFHPDVALLDIGLPGMNGYELARRVRQEPGLAQIVLIAVTGWGQVEDRRQSTLAGFNHHLTKPVDPHDITALVRQAAAPRS